MLTTTLRESAEAVRAAADDAGTLVEEIRTMARQGNNELADAMRTGGQDAFHTLATLRSAAVSVESAAEEVRANAALVGALAGVVLSYVLVRMMWQDWRS